MLVVLGLLTQREKEEARRVMLATVDVVGWWYEKYGVLFEFYDADNVTEPTRVLRKFVVPTRRNTSKTGQRSGGSIRDYHWTGSVLLAMLLELEHGDVLLPEGSFRADGDPTTMLACRAVDPPAAEGQRRPRSP